MRRIRREPRGHALKGVCMLLRLDRYILREFFAPFVLCVTGFTVMMLSGLVFELSDLIFRKRVAVGTVLSMVGYKLPELVVFTLPVSVLFGILLVLGRLVKDRELSVMRMAGLSFFRLAVPLLAFGLAISGVTFWLNEWVVPKSNHEYEQIIRALIFSDVMPSIEENVFFRGTEDRFFYVGEVDRRAKTLQRIMIYETAERPFPVLITATKGRFEDRVWYLESGVRRTFDTEGFVEHEAGFVQLAYPVPDGSDVTFGEQKTTSEMSRAELKYHLDLFQRSGLDVRRIEVEYHLKLALPFASLVLTLLGAPLGVMAGPYGRGMGAVVSIVLLLVYYVVVAVSRSLGGNGVIEPLTAAWIGNVACACLAIFLFFRVERG